MAAKTAKNSTGSAGNGQRVNLIKVITSPLSYMALALLVVESLFGGLLLREGQSGQHATLLIWACIGFIAAFVLLVTGLAVWEPEALKGGRKWAEDEAYRIGENVVSILDGYLWNLPDPERLGAWQTLTQQLETIKPSDPEFQEFCKQIAATITSKAKILGKPTALQGRLPAA